MLVEKVMNLVEIKEDGAFLVETNELFHSLKVFFFFFFGDVHEL